MAEQDSQFRFAEKDLIPDGDKLSVIPAYAAPEGTEVTYLSGGVFRRYRMVDGTWRQIGSDPLWTPYQSFTWSAEAVAKSFASLPAHDLWMIMMSLSGGANNSDVGIQLNGNTGANYDYDYIGVGTANSTAGDTRFRVVNLAASSYIMAHLIIDGRVRSSGLGIVCQAVQNSRLKAVGVNGLLTNAAADLSQIDILQTGATSTNFTGKGTLFYRDF